MNIEPDAFHGEIPSRCEDKGKVSTIIPTYNRAHLICDAIDSALTQDYPNHEVLVIDDGSTDNTGELINSRYRGLVRYVYQQNRGQAAAKNLGIRLANSEFIATLDSDDRWLPGKLSKQVELILSDKEIGLVYTDKRKICGSAVVQTTDQIHYTFRRGHVLDYLLQENFVVSTSVLGRRQAFVRAGLFDETMRAAEDYALWLRMARLCKFDYVDEVLVDYRISPDSIGKKIDSYASHGLTIIDRFLKEYYDGHYPVAQVAAKAYANRYISRCEACLSVDDRKSAREALNLALRFTPFAPKCYRLYLRSFFPARVIRWFRSKQSADKVPQGTDRKTLSDTF